MKKIGVLYFSDNELYRLDVAYGIAALKNQHYKIYTQKIEMESFKEFKQLIKEDTAFFVIFVSYDCYDLLIKTCSEIKAIYPHTKIIVCNSLVNKHYKLMFYEIPQIDFVIIGEYEETLAELFIRFFEQKEVYTCKGIAFKINGEIRINQHRPLVDINSLNYPDRDFDYNGSNFFHIYGSRGCEGHCTFCDRNSLYSFDGKNCVRLRSVKNIIDEIDLLVEKYQCKFISFSDPTFVSSYGVVERLDELYENLKKKNYWIQFTFNIRAQQINEDVIKCLIKLKECGLGKIFVGIESFNEVDLKLYGKCIDLPLIKRCVGLLNRFSKLTKDYYLKVEYGFINFNPYSNKNGLQKNIQSFKDLKLHINPYILDSKLTANSLTKISKKINSDNLFLCDLSLISLREALKHDIKYNFANPNVEKIYELVKKICCKVSIPNDNGIEFLRNRYIHYYQYDSLMEKYDNAYLEWLNVVNEFSYDAFMFVINFFENSDIEEQIDIKIEKFLKTYYCIERRLSGIHQRVIIRLKQIDELIYYRPIFS